jgi:pimeloyl-ACP methyl ester carboxylesterase
MNGSERTHAVVATDRPRLLRLAVLITATALLTLSLRPLTTHAGGEKAVDAKPTIVLVHGAWADPSGWEDVARRLAKHRFATVTPTLDLMSVEGDVDIVRSALDGISGDKILVAHSYGGFVISGAAAGRSDVLGLVYTAGFVPDAGDTILTLGQGYDQSEAFDHLAFTGPFFASPAYIAPNYFGQFFAQDLQATLANAMNAVQQPINAPILGTPSGPVAWHALPSWYAVSGADLMIDPAQQRFMAERAGATTIEFEDASHAGGFTRYARSFTTLIETAVKATTA